MLLRSYRLVTVASKESPSWVPKGKSKNRRVWGLVYVREGLQWKIQKRDKNGVKRRSPRDGSLCGIMFENARGRMWNIPILYTKYEYSLLTVVMDDDGLLCVLPKLLIEHFSHLSPYLIYFLGAQKRGAVEQTSLRHRQHL